VFENRILRGIVGPMREEEHNLYASPHIIRMIKPRRMRWTGI
jgi:hypothetical protein